MSLGRSGSASAGQVCPAPLVLFAAMLAAVAWVAAAAAQTGMTAGPDSAATRKSGPAASTASADTARGDGLAGLTRRTVGAGADSAAIAAADSAVAAAAAAASAPPHLPWLVSWTRTPKAGLQAQVRSIQWLADVQNAIVLRGQKTFMSDVQWTRERYRQQDKTVETRDANLNFNDPQGRLFSSALRMSESWSEDRTVNTVGNSNVNKRDYKQASATFDSMSVRTGGIRHALRVEGSYNEQRGSSLGQRNDYTEGTAGAGVRSRFRPAAGLAVATSVYGMANGGRRALGEQKNPSSSRGDSLGTFVGYARGAVSGDFSVKQSSFAKRYLDFRRNANGIIDTSGVAEKVVQELERNNALTLGWHNHWRAGRVRVDASAGHDFGKDTYRASYAGLKERLRDGFDVKIGWAVWSDSLAVGYTYAWSWDDQRYKGAAVSRGRQYSKRREVGVTWTRDLFSHTQFNLDWQTSLQQTIAERQFNENDRDSYQSNVKVGLASEWAGRFRTQMSFASRHIEDIAIRRSRSANNNVQDTYEIVPAYTWPVAPWLMVQQNFRISIQYTNYVFAGYPSVNQHDNYNKRGNLNTKVTVRPDRNLDITVSNDYNARFNATRAETDAAGNDLYTRDLQQRISTIDLGLSWRAAPGLTLEGATARTKDLKDSFGARVTTTDQRSGEVWVGGQYQKDWGGTKQLSARVRKHSAFGPNVQKVNADYWDADITLSWSF